MSGIGLNELGYDERLYILAFDHRGSFEKMVGDVARVPGAKTLIWEGFQRAVADGASKDAAGILVDGQYGPDVARAAKAGGYKLAMPVEKSGQNESTSSTATRSASRSRSSTPISPRCSSGTTPRATRS